MIDDALFFWTFFNVIIGIFVIGTNYCKDKNLFWHSLMYQYLLYDWAKEELNMIGIVVLEILVTLITLPLTIVVIICGCIQYLWKIFCVMFAKRSK